MYNTAFMHLGCKERESLYEFLTLVFALFVYLPHGSFHLFVYRDVIRLAHQTITTHFYICYRIGSFNSFIQYILCILVRTFGFRLTYIPVCKPVDKDRLFKRLHVHPQSVYLKYFYRITSFIYNFSLPGKNQGGIDLMKPSSPSYLGLTTILILLPYYI